MVREARNRGLTAPVILMGKVIFCIISLIHPHYHVGYYNPLLAYGEQKAIQDASEAGASGFIVVDLPPEEAVSFREKCATAR
jgi:tryptophan synthase